MPVERFVVKTTKLWLRCARCLAFTSLASQEKLPWSTLLSLFLIRFLARTKTKRLNVDRYIIKSNNVIIITKAEAASFCGGQTQIARDLFFSLFMWWLFSGNLHVIVRLLQLSFDDEDNVIYYLTFYSTLTHFWFSCAHFLIFFWFFLIGDVFLSTFFLKIIYLLFFSTFA